MLKIRRSIGMLGVLAALTLAWLGVRLMQRSRPEYYWNRAQAAIARGDRAAAMIHVQRLLQRFPGHGEGHRAMARLCLEEASQAGNRAGYAACPEALEHLICAAGLLGEDLALQKEVLGACLNGPLRPQSQAAAAAARILEAEPDCEDALFVLACHAVRTHDHDQAATLLKRLQAGHPRRPFETYALVAQNEEARHREKLAHQALAAAARFATQLDVPTIRGMTPREQRLMLELLELAVSWAEDLAAARRRASDAITVLERLAAVRPEAIRTLAEHAARVLQALATRLPAADRLQVDRADVVQVADVALLRRADRLHSAAIAAGDVLPVVYLQAATAAFYRGESDVGLKVLEQGLVVAQRLPAGSQKEVLDLHLAAAECLVELQQFSQAEVHIQTLLRHRDSAGWGHLLTGQIALDQGDYQAARERMLHAQHLLGSTRRVGAGIAQACLGLQQWQEALNWLQPLHRAESPCAEAAVSKGTQEQEARIHLEELRAHLGMNDWDAAQPHLEALRGSSQEPASEAVAVAWLKRNRQQAQAAERLAAARRRFPHNVDLLRLDLVRWQQSGRRDEALGLVQQCAAAAPNDLACQLLSCAYRAANQPTAQSLAELDKLDIRLAKRPTDKREIQRARVQILWNAGQLKEAAAILATLGKGPQNAALAWAQGAMELAEGDFTASWEHLAQSLEGREQRNQAGQALLQSVLLQLRQLPPAELATRIDALIARSPQEPFLLLAKALLCFQQKQFRAGAALLDQAKRLDPHNPLLPLLDAEQWLRQGKQERALACLDRVLARDPEHAVALLMAGQAHLLSRRYEMALERASRVLSRRPKLSQAILLHASALAGLGRRSDAQEIVRQHLRTCPRWAEGYRYLAQMHAAAGQLEQAIEVCREGRQRLPEDRSLVLVEIGWLNQLGQYEDAQHLAVQAGGEKPAAAFCLSAATTFLANGQNSVAQEWGQRAESTAREWEKPAVHSLLGNLALRETRHWPNPQKLAEARGHYAAVVAANPKNLVAANNLAWLLATEFNQPGEAVRVLETAVGQPIPPALPCQAAHTLAVAYRRSKRLEDARRVLDAALAKRPNESALLLELGTVLVEAQRNGEAAIVLKRALKVGLPDRGADEARRLIEQIRSGAA